MKRIRFIDMDVEYYILKFYDGEPAKETIKKRFTIKDGERSEIPCPYCGKHVVIRVKTKA